MQREPFPYERHSLETLERRFEVNREIVLGFAQSLNALRRLHETVAGGPEHDLRGGRIVIIGFINHAHHLLAGGLQALAVGNGVVWSTCVRGLIETFGACVMISERPETVTNHLENVPAGKLYNAAKRGRPGLAGDIERLHKIVHPGSGAIYSGFTVLDQKEGTVNFTFGLRQPELDEGREAVTVLAHLAAFLETELQALANNEKVLSTGSVVMVRRIEKSPKQRH